METVVGADPVGRLNAAIWQPYREVMGGIWTLHPIELGEQALFGKLTLTLVDIAEARRHATKPLRALMDRGMRVFRMPEGGWQARTVDELSR